MKSSEHLARLGTIFTVRQAALSLDVPARTATVYLSRWKAQGLVAPAGERSGWWHNLEKNPDCTWSAQNIQPIFPSAVLVGASVLNMAGVTTQHPHALHIAVASRRSYPILHGLDVVGKPRQWYVAHRDDLVGRTADNIFGLPALSPPAALLDLYATPGAWHPDPDDLDLDETMIEAIQKRLLPGQPVPWQLEHLGLRAADRARSARPRAKRAR